MNEKEIEIATSHCFDLLVDLLLGAKMCGKTMESSGCHYTAGSIVNHIEYMGGLYRVEIKKNGDKNQEKGTNNANI